MIEDFWSLVVFTLFTFISGAVLGVVIAVNLDSGELQCTATGIVDGRAVCTTYQREGKHNER